MNFKKLLLGVLAGVALVSCEKDDPEDIHEHEVFSNVRLTLTPVGGGEEVEFHWHDENGDLIVDDNEYENGSLAVSTAYTAVVSFIEEDEHDHEEDLNDGQANKVFSDGDDDDHDHDHDEDEHKTLDAEILAEDSEHQLFYSAVTGLTITYTDEDDNGNPLGIETTFTTDDSFDGGALTITLRHEPNKFGSGVSDGDITNAGGETDVEVTFNLGVE